MPESALHSEANVNPTWTLADRLRKAREVTGLDQRAFAEVIGVSRQSVSNYETGNTRPLRIVLNAWVAVTGVDRAWLETGEEARDV